MWLGRRGACRAAEGVGPSAQLSLCHQSKAVLAYNYFCSHSFTFSTNSDQKYQFHFSCTFRSSMECEDWWTEVEGIAQVLEGTQLAGPRHDARSVEQQLLELPETLPGFLVRCFEF